MATHSSVLACKIPWTEELGGLQSVRPHRVRWDQAHMHTHISSRAGVGSHQPRCAVRAVLCDFLRGCLCHLQRVCRAGLWPLQLIWNSAHTFLNTHTP